MFKKNEFLSKKWLVMALAITLFCQVNAKAQGSLLVTPHENPSKALVTVKTDSIVPFEIILKDDEGTVIHRKRIKNSSSESYDMVYQFKSFPDGDYTLTLIPEGDKQNSKDIAFSIKDQRFEIIDDNNLQNPFRSCLFKRNNYLYLGVYFSKSQPMNFTITDNTGKEVFASIYEGEDHIEKVFDITALEKGVYNVVISNGGQEIVESFER